MCFMSQTRNNKLVSIHPSGIKDVKRIRKRRHKGAVIRNKL